MTPPDPRPRPDLIDQPAAFGFMAPAAWLDFNCELYDAVAELGVEIERIGGGELRLANGARIDLLPLAQQCHLHAREEWSELIGVFLIDAHAGDDEESIDDRFSMIDLRVRLVPDSPADAGVFEALGARRYLEGVMQVLAADVGDGIRPVAVRDVEELGWDADSAWASAWSQTLLLEQADEINLVDLGAGAEMIHVFGERPFTSSFVAGIAELIGPLGDYGAIVSIPHGYSVLIHSIEPPVLPQAISAMIPITRQLYGQGPSSVSPHLYWWRDGELTWIPTYYAPDAIEAYPPPALIDALRGD